MASRKKERAIRRSGQRRNTVDNPAIRTTTPVVAKKKGNRETPNSSAIKNRAKATTTPKTAPKSDKRKSTTPKKTKTASGPKNIVPAKRKVQRDDELSKRRKTKPPTQRRRKPTERNFFDPGR